MRFSALSSKGDNSFRNQSFSRYIIRMASTMMSDIAEKNSFQNRFFSQQSFTFQTFQLIVHSSVNFCRIKSFILLVSFIEIT